MQDCVECAQILGKRLGDELGIPIYLYGYASTQGYRKTVPQIRAGEYEGLKDKVSFINCQDLKKKLVHDIGPL